MKVKTQGLIIREQAIGESDRLVTALTRDEGVVRAFARRAKNYKDSKNAATGLLCYSRLDLYKGRETYIISAAYPIESFFGLRKDIVTLSLAQYFCQLSAELMPESTPAGDCLRLVLNALHFLSSGERSPRLLKPLVELRMLSLAGYMPDLVGCANCGAYESPTMTFWAERGQIFCQDCWMPENGGGLGLSPGALMGIRHMVYSPMEKLFSFSLSPSALEEAEAAAEAYVLAVVQRELTSLSFYKSLGGP